MLNLGRRLIVVKIKLLILAFLVFASSAVVANVTCSSPKDECVEPEGTRLVGPDNDTPLYLPCWRYKTTYDCKAVSDNNCKPLAVEGCSPASTTCRVTWAGVCAVQDVVYDCPIRECDGYEIVCNDGTGFCLDGTCVPQERGKDGDMYQALAALSAAAEASKSYIKDLVVFKGEPAECSKNILGYKNCCKSHAAGWGEGILTECTDAEEKLARQKDAGLAIEIGDYCHTKVAGKCTSKHVVYCVFGSKLGRIIRAAGNAQLGLNFGSPKQPICRGLTPEELQSIDFSKIDFSEFYEDIKQKQNLQMSNQVNPMLQQKLDGIKEKFNVRAKENLKRADELRIR